MPKITKIDAREIVDSRGTPTVEALVEADKEYQGIAAVPSGASTGEHEAWELRDEDEKRYQGKGVQKAVANVNDVIAPELIGTEVTDQGGIDQQMIKLDGTANKSKLGANAILAVSMATARAAAAATQMPLYRYLGKGTVLPVPLVNIFNGGKHADTNLDFQEFKVVPHGAESMSEAVEMGSNIFHVLGDVLRQHQMDTDVGNEGGYAPILESTTQAMDLIIEAIDKAGYKAGQDISIAIDAGAATMFNKKENTYYLGMEKTSLSADQMIALYQGWAQKYPIVSLEDGLDENAWADWRKLTEKLGKEMQIMGDDLLVTNVVKLKKAVKEKAANAILIKVNQVGTLTETLETIRMAQKIGWGTIVSHRSGETCDSFIADLAVATDAGQIKTGSLSRGERTAKYNRLLGIERELGKEASFSKLFKE